MAKVSARVRNNLPDSAFADQDRRKFLIHDETHARLAWQMLDRAEWPSEAAKDKARQRILRALRRFGVSTANFQQNSLLATDVAQMDYLEVCALHGLLEAEDLADAEMQAAVEQRFTERGTDRDEQGQPLLPEELILRIPVAKLGAWYHPVYNVVSFSQRDFDDMRRNFETNALGFPPFIRYGHDSQEGDNTLPAEAKPWGADKAVASIALLEQEGDVLYAYATPNTYEVVADIETKRMRFSSAELLRRPRSKETGQELGPALVAVALTNTPHVPNLPQSELLAQREEDLHFVLNLSKEAPVADETTEQTQTQTVLEKLVNQMAALPEQLATAFSSLIKRDEQVEQPAHKLAEAAETETQEDPVEEKEKEDMPEEKKEAAPEAAEMQKLAEAVTALQTQLAGMTDKLDGMAQENADLKQKLADAESTLEVTSQTASMLSSELGAEKLAQVKASLVREGIPPVLVENAFELTKVFPETVKLADGNDVSLVEKLAGVLRTLPAASRFKLGQEGYAAADKAAAEHPFKDIIARNQANKQQ